MWEWFTTKPYVDSKEVRFIGNVATPWPSWKIAYSKSLSPSTKTVLNQFLEKLQETIKTFTSLKNEAESLQSITDQMGYQREDVEKWWSGVRWVQDQRSALPSSAAMKGQETTTTTISQSVLKQTLDILEKAGAVQKPADGWEYSQFAPTNKLVE